MCEWYYREKTKNYQYFCFSEKVGKLGAEAGKSLADVVALNIGQLGENMALGDVNYLTTSQGQTSSHVSSLAPKEMCFKIRADTVSSRYCT